MPARPPPIILDLSPGDCTRFFEQWAQIAAPNPAPGMLHYVMQITPDEAGNFALALQAAHPAGSRFHALAQQLAAQCQRLDTPLQRILLGAGRVSLTLCIGKEAALLGDLRLQADVVHIDPAWPWDRWSCKALARLCRHGAQIFSTLPSAGAASLASAWTDAGFIEATPRSATYPGDLPQEPLPLLIYAPPWQIKHQRDPHIRIRPGRAAIVGAGLAGASVARALAQRGWKVDVFERGPAVASGASGLPAGLVVPHVSADDSPRSRLSRCGVRLMLEHARQLLQAGSDWDQTGVIEYLLEDPPGQLWHGEAAWVKPAVLVDAWLSHPNIAVHCNAAVKGIVKANIGRGLEAEDKADGRQDDGSWQVLNDQGAALHPEALQFNLVILTHALMDLKLLPTAQDSWAVQPDALDQIKACTPVYGALSYGARSSLQEQVCSLFPAQPVNGHGSFIPTVPVGGKVHWFSGSTFENDPQAMTQIAAQHQANFQKLQRLLPEVARALQAAFEATQNVDTDSDANMVREGSVLHWQSSRCVSQDRMPLVGPIDNAPVPGVWMSAAMGARGLSFSALSAELLVAEIHGEPWPIPLSLAKQLRSTRVRRKTSAALPVD